MSSKWICIYNTKNNARVFFHNLCLLFTFFSFLQTPLWRETGDKSGRVLCRIPITREGRNARVDGPCESWKWQGYHDSQSSSPSTEGKGKGKVNKDNTYLGFNVLQNGHSFQITGCICFVIYLHSNYDWKMKYLTEEFKSNDVCDNRYVKSKENWPGMQLFHDAMQPFREALWLYDLQYLTLYVQWLSNLQYFVHFWIFFYHLEDRFKWESTWCMLRYLS